MRILRCLVPNRAASISGKKVHRWSLKFAERGLENGFAQGRTQDVLSGVLWMGTLSFFATFFTLAMNVAEDFRHFHSGRLTTVELALYGVCLCLIVWICFAVIWAYFPFFHKRLGPICREMFCCLLVIVGMLGYCTVHPYYMARICGQNPWDEETWTEPTLLAESGAQGSDFTDSQVLLIIEAAVTLSHFLIPVRWYIMITVPAAGTLAYMGLVLMCGSPEVGIQPVVNVCLLVITLGGMSLGKRSEEWRARCHFAAMIQEKELRCASEFKLERVQSRSKREAKTKSTASDSPTTVLSTIQDIAYIGRKEHWLIDINELTLMPEACLGRGSFGTIISGSFQGTLVAIKVAIHHRPISQSSATAIANELRVLRQVRHRNIVAFHGACVFERSGGIGLVIEYIDGGMTLDGFIGKPKTSEEMRPLEQRCELVFDVCCALRYLHSRSPAIVHGDLKDSNIMVETGVSGPQAKLLDFGLSRVIKPGARTLGGSLRWSAPEIILNTCSTPSLAADVFSFGRILHLIGSGERPLEKLSRCAIFKLVSGGQMLFACEPIQDKLVVHSWGIVQQCLSSEIAARPTMKCIFDGVTLWPKELGFEPLSKHYAESVYACISEDGASAGLSEQLVKLDELVLASTDAADSDSSSLCAKMSHISVDRASNDVNDISNDVNDISNDVTGTDSFEDSKLVVSL